MKTPPDSFDEFEAQLRAFQPATPSTQATQRVERVLARPHPWARMRAALQRAWTFEPGPPSWIWATAALALAAGLIAFVYVRQDDAPPVLAPAASSFGATPATAAVAPAAASWETVSSTSVWLASVDEGLVASENGDTVQRVREQFADMVEWRDSTSGLVVQLHYPREEVTSRSVGPF